MSEQATPQTDRPSATWTEKDLMPEGAPAIAVTGIDLSRATIVSRSGDEERVHWHIASLPVPGAVPPRLCMMGDLIHHADGWFVGATAVCYLTFRDPEDAPESDDELDEATKVLGAWASNILYDTAAAAARRLVASTVGCHLDIAIQTPIPHFGVVERGA
ncbi:hypothetical protein J2S40_000182 [Nocardioides luteus]|uniref:Uncharacterized protein n=1 Tax=Nocardioides luteus TaxID=1844 RepID=A0ABQ5SV77_9ACTN|nr:hypothetical protein [Nocardioides luteus]MDR7309124.1 hypothetical protein [Nocardioides luteus]GLJ67530.1 hypothetical protein GCM10017579_15660 [Nocardioides luteus]